MFNFLRPVVLSGFALLTVFSFLPPAAGTDVQANVFTNATITTTAQSEVVACGQGAGSIGRKTLVVENKADAANGAVTVTVELRDAIAGTDFTSGYMANGAVATGTITYTAKYPTDDIAARFCNVSAVSASTSTITVTLRKE